MSIKLLILAFEKAEKEIGSTKKTHLARHLSDLLQEDHKYSISERTLRDYYTNYKNGTIGTQEDLKPKLIACLCDYLGYENYADFVSQDEGNRIEDQEEKKKRKAEEEKAQRKRIVTISISIAFGMTLLILGIQKWTNNFQNSNSTTDKCMTWADSVFVAVSCHTGPFSKYGTRVEPLNQTEFQNMRKVEVDAAYDFYNSKNEPLIWYYKNNDDRIEFFTAPGLHPITGKTLKAITPYIIEKYVPKHIYRPESFIE